MRQGSRKPIRRRSKSKSRKTIRRNSRTTKRKSRTTTTRRRRAPKPPVIDVYLYGPQTDRYIIQPTTAPTVTKLDLCEQKGFYSCQMSPMCRWDGTQTQGQCR